MFDKFMRALRRGHRNEKGITGLETAIILIAFVTVAAVFGYAVLSAGIFSAEKGKETVYLGLEEAKSTMEITGSCVAKCATTDNTSVGDIIFVVRNAVGGEPIDMTTPTAGMPANSGHVCICSYIDDNQYVNDVFWAVEWLGDYDADNLLEIGEKAQITVQCKGATGIDGSGTDLTSDLQQNQKFTIEFKPPVGSVVTIERWVPARVDPVMDLH